MTARKTKTDTTAAPATPDELTVEDTVMPTVTRPRRDAKPNRFAAIVAKLPVFDPATAEDGATQPGARISGLTVGELKRARRQLTDAGNALDTPVTIVWNVSEYADDAPDDTPVTIIVGARVKITKPRKNKGEGNSL